MPPAVRIPPRCRGGIHAARDSHLHRCLAPHFARVPRPAATNGTGLLDGVRGNRDAIAPDTGNNNDRCDDGTVACGRMVPPAPRTTGATIGGRGRWHHGACPPGTTTAGATRVPPRTGQTCAHRRGGIHAARDPHPARMSGPAFRAVAVGGTARIPRPP